MPYAYAISFGLILLFSAAVVALGAGVRKQLSLVRRENRVDSGERGEWFNAATSLRGPVEDSDA